MDRPFSRTLSFDDLEVLVLVENGGATPREVAEALGLPDGDGVMVCLALPPPLPQASLTLHLLEAAP